MKQLLSTLFSLLLIASIYAQPMAEARDLEVTNYKQVVSQIEYPQVCKEKGIEGSVIVSLEIGKDGKVVSHEFISFPCTDLRDVVKDALTKFTFNPAINDHGQAIPSRITMPVKFELTI